MGNAHVHKLQAMTKLSFLSDAETEMLSGGWGFYPDYTLGSHNSTTTTTTTNFLGQTSNNLALASWGGSAGNIVVQLGGILNTVK
jgi:hypothetical protein